MVYYYFNFAILVKHMESILFQEPKKRGRPRKIKESEQKRLEMQELELARNEYNRIANKDIFQKKHWV